MLWLNELIRSATDLFLLELSLRAALVLAIAWLAAAIAARLLSSAATRHLIWSLGMGGALALPLCTAILPAWRVAVEWQEAPAVATVAADLPQVEAADEGELLAWMPAGDVGSAGPGDSDRGSRASGGGVPKRSLGTRGTREISVEGAMLPGKDLLTGTVLTWLFAGWLVGAIVMLLPAGLAVASLWSLALRSRRVSEGPLALALAQMQARLGIATQVRLLQSAARTMPMTWGIWRATILLPEGAEKWSAELLRVVLLHELAHVRRRDCLTQLIGQAARAAYWFNPLAWLAAREMRRLQERACDDLVLNAGFAAPDYAEHLLEISAGFRSPGRAAAASLAMARTPAIEPRIASILSDRENRQPLSRRRWGALSLAAVALMTPLSAVQFEAATAATDAAGAAQGGQVGAATAQEVDRAKELADLRAKIAEQYVTPVDEKEIAQGAIKGMLGALRDPYSDFLTPEMVASMERSLAGAIVGIGVQLEREQEQLRVVTALQDSPALAAGIQPGDVILEVDGKPTAGITLTEAVKLIAGAQGSVVRLKIGRAGDQQTQIEVTRGPVKLPTVKGFRRGADQRWDFMLDGNEKIGYVQVTMFGTATPEELKTALERMQQQGVKGLILDLRFCPGGSLDAAVNSAKLFLDSGTIVSLHGREGTAKTIKADGADVLRGLPIVLLVSGQTASSGEVVAGALQDNKRAIVLGTRTVGKGSVQTLIQLVKGDGAIKLTTARYQLPSGRNIDKQAASKSWGIDPDEGYFVPMERAKMKTLLTRVGRDVIGGKSGGQASENAPVTAQWIEETHGDPQLAAALKTLTARLQTGTFAKVSSLSQAQIEQFLKREDIEQRREAVQENLDKINQELKELEKAG